MSITSPPIIIIAAFPPTPSYVLSALSSAICIFTGTSTRMRYAIKSGQPRTTAMSNPRVVGRIAFGQVEITTGPKISSAGRPTQIIQYPIVTSVF